MFPKIRFLLLSAFFVLSQGLFSQLSGTYTVPGSFVSLASAINSLNIGGVTGPVTINIQTGYTETVTTGGYSLYAVAGASSLNTITFTKIGTGTDPTFISYTGTRYPYNLIQDGMWRLIGADYVKIENLTFTDNKTTDPAMMEFAICMIRANANDGCQYNTIQNCTFNLRRENNQNSSGIVAPGSRAIEIVGSASSNHTLAVTPLSLSGAHSYNSITANLVRNCNFCIALTSSYTAQGTTFMDSHNKVGGLTAAEGNTITGFGSGNNAFAPAGGILLEGQQSPIIQSNSITSLPTSGLAHAGSDLYGIRFKSHNYDFSASNNTLSVRGFSTCPNVFCVRSEGSNAFKEIAKLEISGNIIKTSYSNGANSNFYGILNSVVADSLIITANTFTQNSTNTPELVSLIRNLAAIKSHIALNNNIFSINAQSANTIHLIYTSGNSSTSDVSASGNFITNLVLPSGSAAYVSDFISMLGTNRTLSINSNTFHALSYFNTGTSNFILNNSATNSSVIVNANSVTGYTSTSTILGTSHQIYFYRGINSLSPATSTVQISNNSISNFSGPRIWLVGIFSNEGPNSQFSRKLIFNNSITNITSNAMFTGISVARLGDAAGTGPTSVHNNTVMNVVGGNDCLGIDIVQGNDQYPAPPEIRSNVIYSLTGSATSGSGLAGIRATVGGSITISNNKVSNIANAATLPCNGINVASTLNSVGLVNIFNNIVANISSTGTVSGSGHNMGILLSGPARFNIFFNTIYLNAPNPMGYIGLSGLGSNVDSRNNLIVNFSTGIGFGKWASCMASGSAYQMTSNNNFFAKKPNNSILVASTTEHKTMSSFLNAVQGREKNSILDTIIFVSNSFTNSGFMTPSPTVATLVESGAAPISWITTDIYGNPRDPNTPDIGAIEGNFIRALTDSVPPVFSGINFTSPKCNSSMRTLTVQLSDHSGVSSGSLSPNVYYKVNNGSYTSSPGVLTSGTPTVGVYSFTMSYAAQPGDSISWFLIAQDSASNQNIGSWPPVGLNALAVNNISVFPTPETYTLNISLGGTYTVGASGTFTSLTQAANAYNKACITSSVTFVLTNSLYTLPDETFPIVFERNSDASTTNSLLIIPSIGNSVTISTGSQVASMSVIKFLNAKYISFEGNNSNNSRLAVTCSVTSSPLSSLFWLASSNGNGSGNSFIKLSGLDLYGSKADQCYGIIASVNHTNSMVNNGGAYNNSITVTANRFSTLRRAIYAFGHSNLSTTACRNWLIQDNQIGPVMSSASQNLSQEGVFLQNCIFTSIINNTICNITHTSTSANLRGIELASGTSSCTVAYNTIRSMSVVPSTNNSLIGINIMGNAIDAGYLIHNNFIADLNTLSNSTFDYGGIVLGNLTNAPGGIKIHNNSIALNSTALTQTAMSVSGCIVLSAASNIEIKNNILHNNVQNSGSTTRRNFCIYLGSASLSFPLNYFDHNNFSTGPEAFFMGRSSTTYSTLTDIQNYAGQAFNSTSYTPMFISNTDLHLDSSIFTNALLKNTGAPISLYNNDIDNDTRNTSMPDVGADEFTIGTCTSAVAGTVSPASFTICNTTTLNIKPDGLIGGSGTLYQWQQASSSGGSYSNVTIGSGITSTQYNPNGQLLPGTYYLRLSASCPNASASAASNEVTLTVVSVPTINVVASQTAVCPGQVVTIVANGVGSFTWNTGATTSSIVATPVQSTSYFVVYSHTNNICPTLTSSPVFIQVFPTPPVTVNSPTLVCSGTSVTLTALGAASYTWMGSGPQTNSIVHTVNFTTIFAVTGRNNEGCTFTAIHTVQALPAPTISVTGASSICVGQSASLIATGADTYSWSNSVFSATNIVAPLSTTIYTISAYAQGCVASKSHTVHVYNPIPIVITGNTLVCAGQTSTLTASGYPNFTWQPAGNTNSIVVSPSSNTTYTVTGSGTCSNIATVEVTVNPVPLLTITGPTIVCDGQQFTLNVSGANNYTWSNGSQLATIPITISSNTVLTVIGTSTSGCFSTINHSISVSPMPQLTVSPISTTVCAMSPTSFTASGASNYSWSLGSNSSMPIFYPTTSAIITVTGTTGSCSTTQTVAISTLTVPTIIVSPAGATVCAQSVVAFNASGAATYTWSNGGGNNNSASYQALASQIYTVSGSNSLNNCVSTETINVTVNPLPVIAIFGPTQLCAGQSATLLATGASNYLWNTTDLTPFLAINPTTTASYLVVGTSTNGCSASSGYTVFVEAVPSISISPNSIVVCPNTSTQVTASGANSFVWSNGSNGSIASITPSASSIYTVTGTTNGCSSSQTIAVNTLTVPVVGIAPSNITVCAMSPVTFSASGATNYTWSNGGGNASIANYTPTAYSIYSVSATDISNGCTVTANVIVSTYTLPTLSISGASTLCAGESATINVGGAATYSWSTGTTGSQLILTPSSSTVLVVTGTNAAGCVGTQTVGLSVSPLPTVQIVASATAVCAWSTVTISASGADNYFWSTGQTGSLVTLSPSVAAVYTVFGSVNNGCIASNSFTLNTLALPSISVAASAPTVCPLTTLTLTASGASNYTWTGNVTGTVATFIPSSTTIYSVVGENSVNGCVGTQTIGVSTFPMPTLSVNGDTTVCSGLSTTISASGASNYLWNLGVSSPSVVLTPSGNILVSVTGTNSNGCVANAGLTVVVLPSPTISVSGPTALCIGNQGVLTASGANSYSWNTSVGTASILISPTIGTSYTVVGIGLNGCVSNASINVAVFNAASLSLAATPTAACAGQQVTLTASGGNTYTWSNGSSGSMVVVTPTSSTIYTVSSNASGCNADATISVNAIPVPQLIISPGNLFVCPLASVALTVTGASSYVWNGISSGNIYTLSPANTTIITVTGMDAVSGCTAIAQTTVGTFATPIISVSGPTVLCFGKSGSWQASGANSYSWSTGHVTNSISMSPLSSAVIAITGTNQQGCIGSTSFSVTVPPIPLIMVSPSSVTVCEEDSIIIIASGAAQYTWMPGNASGSAYSAPSGSGTYSVSGTDAFGCVGNVAVSEILRTTCTSIKELNAFKHGLSIHPNPTTGVFEVRAVQLRNQNVQIYNNLGMLILEETMTQTSQLFNLATYTKGVYTVIVTTEGYRFVERLILYQ